MILYGDVITDSMRLAIDETARRRKIQADYNARHGIVPASIRKDVPILEYATAEQQALQLELAAEPQATYEAEEAIEPLIRRLEREMKEAAKMLEFERAAIIRNRIRALKLKELELKS